MLVVAGGLIGGYYVLGTRSVANAANPPPAEPIAKAPTTSVKDLLNREIEVVTASGARKLTWAELGAEVDPDEAASLRVDRDKAIKALLALKAKTDKAPQNAYLDLEQRIVHEDRAGQGLDVWGSLPRIATAARTNATKIELGTIAMPAAITKASLGIDDISHVLGFYTTHFPVSDRDRNFNLKLAASKLNGAVLKPGAEWSFNGTVGERSEKEGYKVAHVITAGEMVDGLAGGTCQISTTLFGAAFFAGLDIVKTTNHSRPSAYTPLGFDATVVWPNTDLKLKNPYDFPVVIRYVVANGEAVVEVLGGKERPWSKVTFERHIFERTPFLTEERLDPEIASDETSVDQDGFDGIKLMRFRRFYDKDGKLDHSNKWDVTYPPVTMYIRRGTNPDPDAKHAVQKEAHGPVAPKGDSMAMDMSTKELQTYEQRLKKP
jgi:vancomycin resistance protein YoaR